MGVVAWSLFCIGLLSSTDICGVSHNLKEIDAESIEIFLLTLDECLPL